MNTYRVIVELKLGIREEITLEADSKDQAYRLLVDSFGSELVRVEFLEEIKGDS